MDYSYDSYSSITTSRIKKNMENALKNLNPNALKWIADNREYGEKERYRYKKELDNTLKADKIISEERLAIEQIFKDNPLDIAVQKYCDFLFDRLLKLTVAYENIFSIDINIKSLKRYWESVENISNIDNAHAMYLSSNNWTFSVFNDVLSKLESLLNGDYSLLNFLLSAGEKDIRTAYYDKCISCNEIDERAFYEKIISENMCVYPNGICPCFTFVKNNIPKMEASLDKDKFKNRLSSITEKLGDSKEEFFSTYMLYCKLYYTRLAYDTYEYFCYYSFVRHYAIYITYHFLSKKDEKTALSFKHFASTYQFSKIKEILGG